MFHNSRILSRIAEEVQLNKTAAGQNDEFNEAPDELKNQQQEQSQKQDKQGGAVPPPADQQPPAMDDYGAIPMDEPMPEEGAEAPQIEEIAIEAGLEAAKEFLAEPMMAGPIPEDKIKLLSETAGKIAGTVCEAMMKRLESIMPQGEEMAPAEEMPMDPYADPNQGMQQPPMDQQGMPPMEPAAEEQVANHMVPNQQQQGYY